MMTTLFNSHERDLQCWKEIFAEADARFRFQSIKSDPKSFLSVIEFFWDGESHETAGDSSDDKCKQESSFPKQSHDDKYAGTLAMESLAEKMQECSEHKQAPDDKYAGLWAMESLFGKRMAKYDDFNSIGKLFGLW